MTDPEAKTPAYLLFFLEVFSTDFDFRILDSCAQIVRIIREILRLILFRQLTYHLQSLFMAFHELTANVDVVSGFVDDQDIFLLTTRCLIV